MKNDFDVIIIGAGFAGLYQLYRAREANLRARILEAGDGVGGVWFWNRYPGAKCDIESLDYSYSFSPELQSEWIWTERYASQREILKYINYVADKFDLRRDVQLNTRVNSAHYRDASHDWAVTSNANEQFTARYVVMATGGLSIPQLPTLKGSEFFEGEIYHSADWPKDEVDFSGKRVGLVGTGSSGVQMTPFIAEQAEKLIVFQRTANFSVPAHNVKFTPAALAAAMASYPERRAMGHDSYSGQFLNGNTKTAAELTDDEIVSELEYRWKGAGGGFRMLRAFSDQMTDLKTNGLVAEFVRKQIRATVHDPEKARLLCPTDDLPFGAKRLCVDTNYYETFNRSNVDIVDIKADPILEVTPNGIRLTSGDYPLDIIVLATGFDAMTGALLAIDLKGSEGVSLGDHWQDGPLAYLGLAISGFPNLFMIAGPGSPSVLSNMVYSIEMHVDWITRLMSYMTVHKLSCVEAQKAAESDWTKKCADIADKTLFTKGHSWYMGSNILGKPRVFMAFVGGVPAYHKMIRDVEESGYAGFKLA